MLDIISLVINLIMIALTIYELFCKKSSDTVNQYTQIKIIFPINSTYNIRTSSSISELDEISIQNARWKSKRIIQVFMILICLSLIINLISYVQKNPINFTNGLTTTICMPVRNTMIQLSIIVIVLCAICLVRGWNKQFSVFINFIVMKYFSMKIIMDFISLIGLILANDSFFEKLDTNPQNLLSLFNLMGLPVLFVAQLLWIQYTILRIYKLPPSIDTYEEKEKQLVTCLPAYILPILFLALTIYIRFF